MNITGVNKERATGNLKNLLRKLGIKSADIFAGLSEQDLFDMLMIAQNNFGTPTKIYMNPTSLKEYQKAFKK